MRVWLIREWLAVTCSCHMGAPSPLAWDTTQTQGWVEQRAQGWWCRMHRATGGGRDPARRWGGPGGEVYSGVHSRGGRLWGHTCCADTPRQKEWPLVTTGTPSTNWSRESLVCSCMGFSVGTGICRSSKSKQIALEIKVGMKINLLVLHVPGCLFFWKRKLKMMQCRFVCFHKCFTASNPVQVGIQLRLNENLMTKETGWNFKRYWMFYIKTSFKMQLFICHQESTKYCSSFLSIGNKPGGHIASTGSDQKLATVLRRFYQCSSKTFPKSNGFEHCHLHH